MRTIVMHSLVAAGVAATAGTVVLWDRSAAVAIKASERGPQSFALAQGVIVQLEESPVLYLPNPSEGIDAVDACELGIVRDRAHLFPDMGEL